MTQIRNQALLKKIANRIKKYREEQGVTQEQFFFDTGIHLGRIESTKTNITVSTLDAICKYFDLSIEEFFKEL